MIASEVTTTRQFREAILSRYPVLAHDRPLARLFGWLAFGSWRCEETGRLMLPAHLLANLEQREHLFTDGNYQGYKYLDRFSRQVARVETASHNSLSGTARTMRKWHIPDDVAATIHEERMRLLCGDQVYWIGGRPVNAKHQRHVREETRRKALERLFDAQCDDAWRTLTYLNNLPSNRFTAVLANMEAAQQAARASNNSESVKYTLNLLKAIQSQPLPFYQPSTKGRSVRLFAYTESMLGLPKKVRRALTPDWMELDLRSSQAVILARDWQIESLQKYLAQPGWNIWAHLHDALAVPLSVEIKGSFKKALYSTAYGMEERHIAWLLSRDAGIRGLGKRFISLPLMRDILEARMKRREAIVHDRGAYTAYGAWLSTEAFPVNSIMAQCAQAVEMQLLMPAVDMALANTGKSGFSIVLWQHDGFSIVSHKREDGEHWAKRICDAITRRCETMEYATALEWEQP